MDTNIGRRVALGAVGLALMVTACSGGSLSLPEYAEQAEELIARVRDRIAALDTAWLAQAPTVDGVEEYWNDRLDARVEFLEDFRALKPPTKPPNCTRMSASCSSGSTEPKRHWQPESLRTRP